MLLALICALLAVAGARAQAPDLAAQLERAASLIGGGQLAEAERQLQQVLRAAPEEAAALNLLGAIRAQQRRLDEAEALFARAVRADARLTGARMNLAHLYLLKGDPERAAPELREVLRLEPSHAEAAYRLAWLLLAQGRADETINLVEPLKRSQTPSAPLLAVLGHAHLRRGDAARAEENYLLALGRQAANAEALLGLAQVAQARGDARAAALYLARAREAVGDSPDYLRRLARVALRSGLKGEAVAALKRAVGLRPGEAAYHFALGSAHLAEPADLDEAEQAFRESLRLRPSDAQGQMHLGYVLLKQKRHAEARAWLEKSVGAGAGAPEAFYYLGLIAQDEGEDARAVELFERAIRLAPAFGHAHVALGTTYLKLKDHARAQAALEEGARLAPDDSKAHYQLAVLYARLKNPERAREQMRIVERLKSEGKARDEDVQAPAPPAP